MSIRQQLSFLNFVCGDSLLTSSVSTSCALILYMRGNTYILNSSPNDRSFLFFSETLRVNFIYSPSYSPEDFLYFVLFVLFEMFESGV